MHFLFCNTSYSRFLFVKNKIEINSIFFSGISDWIACRRFPEPDETWTSVYELCFVIVRHQAGARLKLDALHDAQVLIWTRQLICL